MTKRGARWLRLIGLRTVVFVLAASSAWLLLGCGLKISDREASYQYIEEWTETTGQPFSDPFAIAVDDRSGNVAVTDARNQRVVVFNAEGKFLHQFGARGGGPGQFERPTGIAFGPDGSSIYVADHYQDRIQKFSQNGGFILQWGSSGTGSARFQAPNGLAVDRQGRVYVADFRNKVVKVFSHAGKYLRTIGTPGQWGAGALDYPTDVAISPNGAVLVADAYNHRLQAFDPKGSQQTVWGWHLLWLVPRPASGRNGFHVPTGVAFDSVNRFIHVADSANQRVVMLNTGGAFVADWVLPDQYKRYSPTMLAVSPDGTRVYATDTALDRIIILRVTFEH